MTHDAEITATPPTGEPVTRSPAAERMRLHRERRRYGLRCLIIELRITEIDALIRRGLLKSEMRATRQATARERERIKTQKIRERLGGSLYFGDEFPAKPKGMHWKRYWRLWTEHEDAKNYFLAMTAGRILQLKNRFGGAHPC
jgi:hypothetical protein